MTAEEMPIGALSRWTGCAIETIRFYERAGVLPARSATVATASMALVTSPGWCSCAGRAVGFALDEVRALLGLAASDNEVCADVRELAARHLAEVRAKLAGLRAMERVLVEAVAQCDAEQQARCPLIDALSDASPVQPARARARKG